MSEARIFQPAKTAMQSGRAGTRLWVLEFAPGEAKRPDALMGWAGSGDTLSQVRMKFDTLEEAESFAQRHGLAYTVTRPHVRKVVPKNYSANFAYDRVEPW